MTSPFKALEKLSSQSFFQQKKLIKSVMAGETVLCTQCKQPLLLLPPETNEQPGIACIKGCTFIALEFS